MGPPVRQEHLDVIRIPLRQADDRLPDVWAYFLGFGREVADQAQGLGSIERLEVNRFLPHQSAAPRLLGSPPPVPLARPGSGENEGGQPFQPPCDQEQHLSAGRIEKLQVVEREQHGAVVRHRFHHSEHGLSHAQANRVGGRIGRRGDAGIDRSQARTHSARLGQPERLRGADRRIPA